MTRLGPESLIDPLTGVIVWVRPLAPDPVAPPSMHTWVSHTSDVYRTMGWPADRYGTGTAFDDPVRARAAAIGEAVERYCGNRIAPGLTRASHSELAACGRRAVDPDELALYSEAQHGDPGCPFVRFDRDLSVQWTEGRSLSDNSAVLVPASLVWVNYFLAPHHLEPPTNFAIFAGIAAGPTRDAAETSALEELIERDATMVWWHSGGPAMGLDLDDPALAAQLAPPPRSPVEVRCVLVPNRYGVPVVAAVLVDNDHDLLTLGVAARPDAPGAARKATAEAWSLRTYALGLLDPDGLIWRAAEAGLIDGSPLKPFRADRRYTQSYRPDFRDITDLACQTQIYLDPAMHEWCNRILEPARRQTISTVPSVAGNPRTAYLSLLERTGVEPVAVDLTTSDVALAGLHVTRVVAPGLYSNPPAGFPFLGGTRLCREPVTLGLADRELAEDELVLAPLPHT